MHRSQPDSTHGRCACGREPNLAAVTSYRSINGTYLFHRCECGMEWTEHVTSVDQTQAVTGDEVIDVHAHLKAFHGSIRELLGVQTV
jgi:hypothetical protein